MTVEWIVPIAVALAAPIFTYLVAARKLSGRIHTSEAGQLWEEANALRIEYRERAITCESQLKAARNEISTVTARNSSLSRENKKLREDLRDAQDRSV